MRQKETKHLEKKKKQTGETSSRRARYSTDDMFITHVNNIFVHQSKSRYSNHMFTLWVITLQLRVGSYSRMLLCKNTISSCWPLLWWLSPLVRPLICVRGQPGRDTLKSREYDLTIWELLGSNSLLGTSREAGKEPGLAWTPALRSGLRGTCFFPVGTCFTGQLTSWGKDTPGL